MLQEQHRRTGLTIDEINQEKSRVLNNWHKANPGISDETDYESKRPKIYILKEILESDAYRSLSKSAMLIYQDFLAKRIFIEIGRGKMKRWQLINNGEIVYPFLEAERKGLDMTKFLIDDPWRSYDPEIGQALRLPRIPKTKDTRKDRGFALLMNDPQKKKAILKKRRSKKCKSQC
jgi:hypothetical protein